MTAQAAVGRHLVIQRIIRRRQSPPAQVMVKYAVDAADNGAHVVAGRGQAEPTLRNNTAAAGKVGPAIVDAVAGGHVKGPEKMLSGGLQRAFEDHIFRKPGEYPADVTAMKVRTEDQAHIWIVVCLVVAEQIDDFEDAAVQGWFAPQQPDAFPLNALIETFFYKAGYCRDRQFFPAGRLCA